MRRGFYSRLAAGNLNKNRRFFIPYMLSGAGLLAAYFIIRTLSCDERLAQVRGGSILPVLMGMGSVVMAILTVIMLLYTNSFLMKQRTKEYGLYQVLGMEKRHVIRILFFETLFSTIVILVMGLVTGMVFYKLCSLLICRILKVDSILGIYYINGASLIRSVSFFLAVYLLCFLWNLIRIGRMKPIEQLHSEHTGEKEPGVKWPFLLVGMVTLAAGYYLALTTMNPLRALNMFLVAVILVIIGTYCLFIAGSIAVLKLLKKNQHYYYKPRHMVAVSGLLYRMKQNAVGLASITILACGVLVMLSTSVSLYAGVEDSVHRMYPEDVYLKAAYYIEPSDGEEREEAIPLKEEEMKSMIQDYAKKQGLEITSLKYQHYLESSYVCVDGELLTDVMNHSEEDAVDLVFITSAEYEKLTGEELNLKKHEIAVRRLGGKDGNLGKEIKIGEEIFKIQKQLEAFPVATPMMNAIDTYGIVLPDQKSMDMVFAHQSNPDSRYPSEYTDRAAVSFKESDRLKAHEEKLGEDLYEILSDYMVENQHDSYSLTVDSIWEMEDELLGMFGTLLFLGILLGLVFLFATAMIIYYKQISEGYEDRSRFQILTKIGMSSEEVKKTIANQILLVFFLPLLVAAIHIAVAFPMITRVLKILYLNNVGLFMGCTAGAFAVFAVIYVVIYLLTARVYYRIVY